MGLSRPTNERMVTPSPTAKSIPLDSIPAIFRAAKFETTMICRPTNCSTEYKGRRPETMVRGDSSPISIESRNNLPFPATGSAARIVAVRRSIFLNSSNEISSLIFFPPKQGFFLELGFIGRKRSLGFFGQNRIQSKPNPVDPPDPNQEHYEPQKQFHGCKPEYRRLPQRNNHAKQKQQQSLGTIPPVRPVFGIRFQDETRAGLGIRHQICAAHRQKRGQRKIKNKTQEKKCFRNPGHGGIQKTSRGRMTILDVRQTVVQTVQQKGNDQKYDRDFVAAAHEKKSRDYGRGNRKNRHGIRRKTHGIQWPRQPPKQRL